MDHTLRHHNFPHDSVSVIPRTWPRASAVAGRHCSNENVKDPRAATRRLVERRWDISPIIRKLITSDVFNWNKICSHPQRPDGTSRIQCGPGQWRELLWCRMGKMSNQTNMHRHSHIFVNCRSLWLGVDKESVFLQDSMHVNWKLIMNTN
jgi:hypothetical protein